MDNEETLDELSSGRYEMPNAERLVEAISDDELRAALQVVLKHVVWDSATEDRNQITWGIKTTHFSVSGDPCDGDGVGLLFGVYRY